MNYKKRQLISKISSAKAKFKVYHDFRSLLDNATDQGRHKLDSSWFRKITHKNSSIISITKTEKKNIFPISLLKDRRTFVYKLCNN